MSVKYLSDDKGKVTAVQLPIEEWELLKINYPDIDQTDNTLLQWQIDLIDERLLRMEKHPEKISPIEGLISELSFDVFEN